MKPANILRVGDTFTQRDIRVTVLGDREDIVNMFGMSEFRLWCRRDDTGEEGYVTFGETGLVHV